MSSELALPNGLAVQQQRKDLAIQNFAVCCGQIYNQLVLEDYRAAVEDLKARQRQAEANGTERPTNLVVNPMAIGGVAALYARFFAFELLPVELGWIERPEGQKSSESPQVHT